MKNMERIELSFRELWKAFTQNEGEEVSEDVDVKEIIENDTTLSEQDKKTLLNSIKNRDKLEKNLFKDSLIVKKNKDDIEKVSKYKWHVLSNGYIATTLKNRKLLLLHRYITNCPEGKVVDHINHDRSDNRKINLRICTAKENAQNRIDKPKGITKIEKRDKEYFVLQLHGRYIGCFKELQKAKDKREEILNKEL